MTREQRLQFCQVCMHQKISLSQGIICRLTNRVADFEVTCPTYEVNQDLKNSLERIRIGNDKHTASQVIRMINYIIDSICIAILYAIVLVIFKSVLLVTSPVALTRLDDDISFAGAIMYLVTILIYYCFFETLWGRTPAKFLTGTRVVDESGNKVKFGTIFRRTLCRFIPFEPFSYLGSGNSGWHDELTKTRVIKISALTSR